MLHKCKTCSSLKVFMTPDGECLQCAEDRAIIDRQEPARVIEEVKDENTEMSLIKCPYCKSQVTEKSLKDKGYCTLCESEVSMMEGSLRERKIRWAQILAPSMLRLLNRKICEGLESVEVEWLDIGTMKSVIDELIKWEDSL